MLTPDTPANTLIPTLHPPSRSRPRMPRAPRLWPRSHDSWNVLTDVVFACSQYALQGGRLAHPVRPTRILRSDLVQRSGYRAMGPDGATWGRGGTVVPQCCWSGALCTCYRESHTHRSWLMSLPAAPSCWSERRSDSTEHTEAGGPMRWPLGDVCIRPALSMGGGTRIGCVDKGALCRFWCNVSMF